MKPLDLDQRTENWLPDNRTPSAHCGVCGDNGWADTASRVATYNGHSAVVDEVAPCPFCVRGYRQDFPAIPAGENGREWIKPPWGDDGYWQGRDLPEELVEAYVASQQAQHAMSQAEQLAAIHALTASVIGSIDAKMA